MAAGQINRSKLNLFPLFLVLLSCAVLGTVLSVTYLGLDYYMTATSWRWSSRLHPIFGATAPLGLIWGIIAGVLFVTNLFYLVRCHVRALQTTGSLSSWLNWHVVSGLLGGALVLIHSAYEIRSLITETCVWSLVVVLASGVMGRFMIRYIPRARDGHVLPATVLQAKLSEVLDDLGAAMTDEPQALAILDQLRQRIDSYQSRAVPRLLSNWRELRWIRRQIRTLFRLARSSERVADSGRLGPLIRTANRLNRQTTMGVVLANILKSWRVIHRVLSLVFFATLIAHVAATTYYGFVHF